MAMTGAERQRRYMERKLKAASLTTPSTLINAYEALSPEDRKVFRRKLKPVVQRESAELKKARAVKKRAPEQASLPKRSLPEPKIWELEEIVGDRIARIVRDRRSCFLDPDRRSVRLS
jgi:hypothetical protein